MHLDIDAAVEAGYSDVFAHGMFSMALLGRALHHWVGQENVRRFTVRFVSITPIDSQPTCYGTVIDVNLESIHSVAIVDLKILLPDGTATLLGDAEIDVSENREQK